MSANYEPVLTSMSVLAECYNRKGEQDGVQRCLKLVERCQRELLNARQGGLNI